MLDVLMYLENEMGKFLIRNIKVLFLFVVGIFLFMVFLMVFLNMVIFLFFWFFDL